MVNARSDYVSFLCFSSTFSCGIGNGSAQVCGPLKHMVFNYVFLIAGHENMQLLKPHQT